MQSIRPLEKPTRETDESDFRPGMTLVAHTPGPSWSRGAKGVICARRIAEMLPPLGGVTLYFVLLETGLQVELTMFDLRRFFFVGLVSHPAFDGYEFKGTRELHVDFHAGKFNTVFRRRETA